MNKFASISGVYLILSATSLVFFVFSFLFPNMFGPIVLLAYDVFGTQIASIISFFVAFNSILLLFTGFYLRTKFENNSEQLQNIKWGIRLNMVQIVILLLLIIYSVIGARLD